MEMNSIYGFAFLVALVLNAVANLMMRVGMTRIESSGGLFKNGFVAAVTSVLVSPVLLVGLACFALNAAFYMFALQSKTLQISLAYPLMVGGGYAIIATVGYFSLGDHLNVAQKIGVALILGGLILVATQTGSTTST